MDKPHLRLFISLDDFNIPLIKENTKINSLPRNVAARMQKKGFVKVKEDIKDILGRSYSRDKWVKAK